MCFISTSVSNCSSSTLEKNKFVLEFLLLKNCSVIVREKCYECHTITNAVIVVLKSTLQTNLLFFTLAIKNTSHNVLGFFIINSIISLLLLFMLRHQDVTCYALLYINYIPETLSSFVPEI